MAIRRHLTYANVAATLALVLAMGGGAIAATGGFSSGGTLRACANGEGRLKLLKAGGHCGHGQQTVAWNQTGPAGPRGAAGAGGAPGAPGAPGSPGTKGVEGQRGPSGETADVKWASIEDKGHMLSGHGVVGSAEAGTHYAVAFDREVSDCALVATPNITEDAAEISVVAQGTEAKVYMKQGASAVLAGFSVVAYC